MPFLFDRKNKVEPIWMDWDRRANKSGLRALIYNSQTSCYYKGEWQNNLKNGSGQMINPKKGIMYEGSMENNLRHGFGTLCKAACDRSWVLVYRGLWKFGKRHGYGCSFYPDGSYYEGYFENNKRHGIGRMWWPDESFHIGEWKDDKMHGIGMFVFANGNRYEGIFANGLKHGQGRMIYLHEGQEQAGTWIRGCPRITKIFDIHFRQTSICSTKYPIRKLELVDPEVCIARVRRYLYKMNSSDTSLPDTLNGSEVTETFSVGSRAAQNPISSSSSIPYRPYLSCGYEESQIAPIEMQKKLTKSKCGKRIPINEPKKRVGCYPSIICKK